MHEDECFMKAKGWKLDVSQRAGNHEDDVDRISIVCPWFMKNIYADSAHRHEKKCNEHNERMKIEKDEGLDRKRMEKLERLKENRDAWKVCECGRKISRKRL